MDWVNVPVYLIAQGVDFFYMRYDVQLKNVAFQKPADIGYN